MAIEKSSDSEEDEKKKKAITDKLCSIGHCCNKRVKERTDTGNKFLDQSMFIFSNPAKQAVQISRCTTCSEVTLDGLRGVSASTCPLTAVRCRPSIQLVRTITLFYSDEDMPLVQVLITTLEYKVEI